MILYLDTSALVKLFINETYSDLVREYYQRAELISTSVIAYVEFNSAISRLTKEGFINTEEVENLKSNFELHWNHLKIIDLDELIIKSATKLLYKTELRAFDSIHLASADFLRERSNKSVTFACFDKRLVNGANLIGLKVMS